VGGAVEILAIGQTKSEKQRGMIFPTSRNHENLAPSGGSASSLGADLVVDGRIWSGRVCWLLGKGAAVLRPYVGIGYEFQPR